MTTHTRTFDIPTSLYLKLATRAKDEKRSANAELVVALEKHLPDPTRKDSHARTEDRPEAIGDPHRRT